MPRPTLLNRDSVVAAASPTFLKTLEARSLARRSKRRVSDTFHPPSLHLVVSELLVAQEAGVGQTIHLPFADAEQVGEPGGVVADLLL
jgi:hypothetical protein